MSAEHKAMIEKAFYECKGFDTLLGVYTGAASMLHVSGEFDTQSANEIMDAFKARLQELMFHENVEAGAMSVDLFIHNFFRSK